MLESVLPMFSSRSFMVSGLSMTTFTTNKKKKKDDSAVLLKIYT